MPGVVAEVHISNGQAWQEITIDERVPAAFAPSPCNVRYLSGKGSLAALPSLIILTRQRTAMRGIHSSQLAGSARDIPPHPSFASGDPENCNGLDWAAGAPGRRGHDFAARRGFLVVEFVAFSRRSGTSRSRKPARKPMITTICGAGAWSPKFISPMVRRCRRLQLTRSKHWLSS